MSTCHRNDPGNQAKTATFTGTEPYVDLVWDKTYANSITLGSAPVMSVSGAAIPTIRLTNVTNAGCRIEPTALFAGSVSVVNIRVQP